MPLEVRWPGDQRLLHHNSYIASDFATAELVEESREIDLPTGKGYMAHWYFDGIRLGYGRWRYSSLSPPSSAPTSELCTCTSTCGAAPSSKTAPLAWWSS